MNVLNLIFVGVPMLAIAVVFCRQARYRSYSFKNLLIEIFILAMGALISFYWINY